MVDPSVDPPRAARDELVDTLVSTGVFDATEKRELVVDLLREELGSFNLRHHNVPRYDCLELVRYCQRVPGGLFALADVLAVMGEDAAASAARICSDEIDAFASLDGEMTPQEWGGLRQALWHRPLPDAPVLVRAATRNRVVSLPPYCRTMWHAFVVVVPANADSSGVLPWLTFLNLIADKLETLDKSAARTVRRCSARAVRSFDVAEDAKGATMRAHSFLDDAAGQPRTGYLVVRLEPKVAEPDQVIVSSWRQWHVGDWHPVRGADVVVRPAALPQTVENLVEQMEAEWADPATGQDARPMSLTLEFVLPDELLNLPIESWQWGSSSLVPGELGLSYPVVVRSLRRMRTPMWKRRWHRKWASATAASRADRPPTTHRSSCRQDGDFTTLHAELMPDHVVCLVLSEPPGHPAGIGDREVDLALREGLPAMLWQRGDCSSPVFLEAIETLLGDNNFATLPERVLDLRRSARNAAAAYEDSIPGINLVLLWDDPGRMPDTPAA